MCQYYNSFEELPEDLKSKFGVNSSPSAISKAKKSYVDFINKINENGDELVGGIYESNKSKVKIRWKECGHIRDVKVGDYRAGKKCGEKSCKSMRIGDAQRGREFTEEHKQKLSKSHMGKPGTTKGRKLTEEHKQKLSEAKKGKPSSFKGKHHSEEAKQKMSSSLTGRKSPMKGRTHTDEAKQKLRDVNVGRKLNNETKKKIGDALRGEKSSSWKGGITEIHKHLSGLNEVVQWRYNSKLEANFTCQVSGKTGSGCLNTHHLYSFNSIILDAHIVNNIEVKTQVKDYTKDELLAIESYVISWHSDTSNAITLHKDVHCLFHQEYGFGDNTPEQFEEFKQRYSNGEFNDRI